MKYLADFHIHSKYSRATSKNMDLENIDKWAQIKGVNIIGTGDFTHPVWFKELKQKLEPAEAGLFKIKNSKSQTRFVLTAEISSIYSKNNKTRKIHNILFAPSFRVAEKINSQLDKIGNIKSDGRPILGLSAKELAKIILNISNKCLIVPAHIWTPWFSVFGSRSGFDSIEECFEGYSKYIYALETGLSSDPYMNWKWSELNKFTLISNSDAHSPSKIGREANVFEGEKISYDLIRNAIINSPIIQQNGSSPGLRLTQTIEFFPQQGKYHYDGHRKCNVCFSPAQSEKHKNICPKCNKPLTIGVMNRVCQLSDQARPNKSKQAIPFKRLIPLEEIIANVLDVGAKTKKVENHYNNLINKVGSEFKILLDATLKEISTASLPEIAKAIINVRKEKVEISPGHDGRFGKISILNSKKP